MFFKKKQINNQARKDVKNIDDMLEDLHQKIIQYKAQTIDTKAYYHTLLGNVDEFTKKMNEAFSDAKKAKQSGQPELIVKTKLEMYITYKNTTEKFLQLKDNCHSKLLTVISDLEVLLAKYDIIKAHANVAKLQSSLTYTDFDSSNFKSIDSLLSKINANLTAIDKTNAFLADTPVDRVSFNTEIDELYASI